METQHIGHTSRSHSRTRSHITQEQETRNLRLEIDYLCKKLCCRAHSRGNWRPLSSLGSEDSSYRPRFKTPPSESFSTSSCVDRVERHSKRHEDSSFPMSMGNDAMGKALRQIAKSPFTRRIDRAKLPHRFTQLTFIIYNGRIDLMEHVSHFNQRMAIHSRNEALMCKVFTSILRLVAMRWFDGLEEGSLGSYEELTRAFGARFVTCSRASKPLDSLLPMVMREGETLKT